MNIVQRAQNLVMKPKQEWAVIDTETHTVQGLYTQYVMILAAIGPIASFIGFSLVGIGPWRMPIGAGIAQMVVSYLLGLGSVYVFALVIDALAPSFGGQKNFIQAFKVAAFAPTAAWLAGVFAIIPALAVLGTILGLYTLYLLYLGLPMLMKTPEDKAVPYVVVAVIVMIVLAVVIGAIAALLMPAPVRGF
jgi:hypothetical protein